MSLIGWSLDVAREQSPSLEWLREVCARSLAAGYNALGLYLEHRYAYRSAPWVAAPGALTPEVVGALQAEFVPRGLRIIPLLNTLGHMEGFIRTQGGEWLAETRAPYSLQLCPSRLECVEFARGLIADAIADFSDPWIHVGGDEAFHLGACERCRARLADEGRPGIYGAHYGQLCRDVLERGRRPCIWGDMLLKHPEAAARLPRETLVFNWQYDDDPADTHAPLRAMGFEVVTCPGLKTYHAAWCDWRGTRSNVDRHVALVRGGDTAGLWLTTWEFHCLSSCRQVMPLVYAVARRATGGDDWRGAVAAEDSAGYADAVWALGDELYDAAPGLARTWPPEVRLRHALLRSGDPFELWRAWGAEAAGGAGARVLALCERALRGVDGGHPIAGAARMLRASVAFTAAVTAAEQAYARRQDAEAAGVLRKIDWQPFAELAAQIAAEGGARADVTRVERAARLVGEAADRIKRVAGQVNGRPAFDTVIRPNAHLGDQGAWLSDTTVALGRMG